MKVSKPMMIQNFVVKIAACVFMFAISASSLEAQYDEFCGPCCPDLQYFKPVDFDFNCQPIRCTCGYFFHYDKVSWALTGERASIGNQDVTYLADTVYTNGLVPGVAPQSYEVVNGLNDVPPYTDFGWGERYEFGHRKEKNAWEFVILVGPEVATTETYGFGVGSNPLGFGNVHINFALPSPDYLLGFADWTQNGQEFIGTIDDITNDASIDRFIEDIDGSGDFSLGDVITWLPTWELVGVRNSTETAGFEVMRTHRLNKEHRFTKDQINDWDFGYGFRYFRIKDRLLVNAFGGVWGDSQWDTLLDNQIVGPQVLLRWQRQRSRWNATAQGRFTFGYNVTNWDQTVHFGQDLVPGEQTGPLYADPTVSSHGRSDQEFSPLAELRLDLSYQVTHGIALRLGATSMYVENIRRAAQQVNYTAPSFGFRNGGTQEVFISGANFGFDVVY